ncbi:MAG TPA: tetratricopeptide repeat protein [Oligoflexus sp.]|uniref:tetratricopeptide repeat protein n=1 Tax=Oligoflexus sp. TaxID=1971216 RepID=UPI002D29ADB1|nr:tetratricopeptide repeat protein [Oligoflexus sp.]HYX34476.1 tetratricopeptide repeat protein [Oligoflexus sp.]
MGNYDKDLSVLVLSAQKEHGETIVKALKKLELNKIQLMDNGIDALQLMTEQSFGFLIFDQNIQFISGWLLIKEIKTSDRIPNIPVILFGKDEQPESDDVLKRYGLVQYLQFPVQPSDLDVAIHSTLSLFTTSGTVENKYTKAKDSLLKNKSKEAIELYSELRGLTKNSPRSSMGLAQAFLQAQQVAQADKVFEELARSDESSPSRTLLQARILLQKNQSDPAIDLLKKILAQIPNGFYYTKAIQLLMDFQQFRLAAPLCHAAMRAGFERPEFLLCLGKDRYNEGDVEGALEFTQQHESAFDMTSEMYNLRGVCFKKMGDHNRAIDCYEQALRLKPTDARVYFNLAMCSIQMKRNDAAVRYLEACLQYAPSFPRAREKLNELRKRNSAA